jgi:hypothetical protein
MITSINFMACSKFIGMPNRVIERNATAALNLEAGVLFNLSGLSIWLLFVASAHH